MTPRVGVKTTLTMERASRGSRSQAGAPLFSFSTLTQVHERCPTFDDLLAIPEQPSAMPRAVSTKLRRMAHWQKCKQESRGEEVFSALHRETIVA